MNDTDKVKMTIHIGGEHIQYSADFNRQLAVRDAEKAASELYNTWRLKWPSRTDKEILAMVAFQFASYYQELLERYEHASRSAEELLAVLDSTLNADEAEQPGEE